MTGSGWTVAVLRTVTGTLMEDAVVKGGSEINVEGSKVVGSID